jgi:hypothetical protein
MNVVWGIVKAVALVFSLIIAVLVVIDGSLLANLTGKTEEAPPA